MKKTYELCICLLVQKIYTNIEIKLKHGEEMHKISVAPSSSVTSVQAGKSGQNTGNITKNLSVIACRGEH